MTAVRRSLVALALVALTAASALAQATPMNTGGGMVVSPAPIEAPQVENQKTSFKQLVAQVVARAQWRQPTKATVIARKTAKRIAR